VAALDFNAPTAEEKAEVGRRKAAISRRIHSAVEPQPDQTFHPGAPRLHPD
jgi:hypothetical protein